jgi:hypothetical protein
MATKGKHGGPGEHERHSDRDREDSGDDPLRHAQIIQRRWLGSPPPTFERYARAFRQWQRLPGAVVRPATTVTVEPPAPSGTGRTSGSEEGEP